MRRMMISDRELREMGYVRAHDGALLDDRDGFYTDHSDPIATFDTRTHVAVSRSLFEKLILLAAATEPRAQRKEAA